MTTRTETAILAGGCFWGVQELVRKLPGVITTRVGYTGGDVPNATYRNHHGHAEAIEIVFDPDKITYRDLLEFFFQIHDPTTRNRQGNDIGYQRTDQRSLSDEQNGSPSTIADVAPRRRAGHHHRPAGQVTALNQTITASGKPARPAPRRCTA